MRSVFWCAIYDERERERVEERDCVCKGVSDRALQLCVCNRREKERGENESERKVV